MVPWRYAATSMIAARSGPQSSAFLVVQRSGKNRHLPDTVVFPGGVVEHRADFDTSWLPILKSSGLSLSPLFPASSGSSANRPATFIEYSRNCAQIAPNNKNNSNSQSSHVLPAELGFRLAAIRETFEETGLLLCRAVAGTAQTLTAGTTVNTGTIICDTGSAEVAEWRSHVQNDASCLKLLCKQLKLVPDVWALREWSCWLTPVLRRQRRHDTAFFVVCLDRQCSDILLHADQTETAHIEWASSGQLLERHGAGKLSLMPPQIYELGRLSSLAQWCHLDEFSRNRSQLGCRREFPVIYRTASGAIVGLLQGDDQYPETPDFLGELAEDEELPLLPDRSVTNLHRSINMKEFHCNITPNHGHLPPAVKSPTSRL